jgi:hypothetical protein
MLVKESQRHGRVHMSEDPCLGEEELEHTIISDHFLEQAISINFFTSYVVWENLLILNISNGLHGYVKTNLSLNSSHEF